MILDSLKNGDQYSPLHPNFAKALKFVTENAQTIPVGKYYLDGDNLFVTIVETDLRPTHDCKMEAHRKYIDIQIVLDGIETFGWGELGDCQSPTGEFDTTKDIVFFADQATTLVTARAGQFVIFFPQDVHAPLIGQGRVRKAIVKVKVQEPEPQTSRKSAQNEEIALTAEQSIKFEALRKWRNELATFENVQSYTIASNNDLKRLAIANPQNINELTSVKSFKENRAKRYGDDIVALLCSL